MGGLSKRKGKREQVRVVEGGGSHSWGRGLEKCDLSIERWRANYSRTLKFA